jgi:hypothetical protein
MIVQDFQGVFRILLNNFSCEIKASQNAGYGGVLPLWIFLLKMENKGEYSSAFHVGKITIQYNFRQFDGTLAVERGASPQHIQGLLVFFWRWEFIPQYPTAVGGPG